LWVPQDSPGNFNDSELTTPINKMNTQTSQLKLTLGFIAQQSIGYNRDFHFKFPVLALQAEFVVRNLEGKITVSRTSEGLLTQGEFRAIIDSVCSRCLAAFEDTLKTDFTELYTFPTHVQEDTELIYPEDGQIDFTPILGEYLMIELPINPLCKGDCKGLCVVCGNDLNNEACDHGTEAIDPRLEILKSLLDED
jgi:uncharacterized protein